jgi:hypothetical protein
MNERADGTSAERYDWPAYVDAMTALHGLRLDPARRAEVVRQLERIEVLARRVTEFPLAAEVEPGPVFRP